MSFDQLGRYVLLQKLAAGGMAEIFLAKFFGAEGFEKDLVIKKILPQWSYDQDFTAMLIDEAKIAVQLNHPNIIQVYELGREDDVYYIAMEWVQGVDLRRVIQKATAIKKKIPLEVVLGIAIEVLEGLSYAHSKKDAQGKPLEIIHRDISPQNILISYDGQVKITDFGIAKAASRSQETAHGVLKGKFAYMSPEQAGQESLDARSDLFSLAIVLYEILTGERLFSKGSDVETLERVRRCSVDFSSLSEKSLPQRLREILIKALSKNPGDRYPTAQDFKEELVRFARRTKKNLSADVRSRFMSQLFSEEMKVEPQPLDENKNNETKLYTQATRILQEDKDTQSLIAKEVFVQHFDSPAPFVPVKNSKLSSYLTPFHIGAGGSLFFIILMILFWPVSPSKKSSVSMGEKASPPVLMPPETQKVIDPVEIPETQAELVPSAETLPSPKMDPVKNILVPLPEKKISSSPVPPKQEPIKKEKVEDNQSLGYVSLQAIPWGSVLIDGSERGETPIRRLALAPGSHKVEIRYEPEDAVVTTRIVISPSEEVICVANFRMERGIQCN